MKSTEIIHRTCLYFSCWSKKGYSIFAGLGHEVRISRLAIPMYDNVLLKSASHGVIINMDSANCLLPIPIVLTEQEDISGKREGEVCPGNCRTNNILKGIYRLRAIYPFFI